MTRRAPLVATLLLAGCGGPQDFLHAAGPAAQGLARLGWFALVATGVTIAVMWVLLAWVATRPRGSLLEHAPIAETRGKAWVAIGGFFIPLVVLLLLFVASLSTLRAFPMETAPHGFICRSDRNACAPAALRVVGRQWWFDVEYVVDGRPDLYVRAPTELHIPTGQPVVVELVTRDVIHSFWVPKLHGKVDLIPGQTNEIEIEADQPGVYAGECAEFCGMQHANMRLSVIAQPPAEYDAWLVAQRRAASPPSDELASRGAQIFMGSACALCHTIRGTDAHGQIGPDLTHLASRSTIAGGMLPNDTAALSAWVTHAQSRKPGVQMPDVTAFSGQELRALVAYLQTLH